ncbi:hypothetical protein Taro_053398, partial [Colocasia esculenta]|nr:hypothetical protein [Colocasia esculenta]
LAGFPFSLFSLSSLLRGGEVSLSSFSSIRAWWWSRRLVVERRSSEERGGGSRGFVKTPLGVWFFKMGCDSICSASGVFVAAVGMSACAPGQVLTPDCYFDNPFLGAVCGGTGVCSSLTSWSFRGAGWFCLWALDLVEVQDVGACVMRLGSHVVAPVFRELLCLDGCSSFASALLEFLLLWLVRDWLSLLSLVREAHPLLSSGRDWLSQEFVAGQSWWRLVRRASVGGSETFGGPWRGSGRSSRYSGIIAQGSNEICSELITMDVPKKGECLMLLLGARAASVVAIFARVAVGFFLGMRIRVGVLRRLREPACGVAFTGAGLLPVDPVEGSCLVGCPLVVGVCPCWISPCCLGVSLLDVPLLLRCVLLLAVCLALCAYAPLCAVLCSVGILARAKQMLVCHVEPLVERCDTCLWLLSALCWLFVNSGEVFPEFFSVGSGRGEVFSRTMLCSFLVVTALPSGLRCIAWLLCSGGVSQNYFVVVLVRVPLPLGLLLYLLKSSTVLPPWFEVSVVWLVTVVLPSRLRCISWLPCVLVRFPRTVGCCPGEVRSQDYSGLIFAGCCATSGLRCGAFHRVSGRGAGKIVFLIIFRVSRLRWGDFVCSQGREVGFVSHALWALPDGSLVSVMGVWLVVLLWKCQSRLVGAHCCDLLVESSSHGLDCCVQSARLLLVKVVDLDPVCVPVFGQFAVLFASKFLGCACGTTCGSLWRRPVVGLLPLLFVGCLGWWCFHMAFGAMSRTVSTFVAKGSVPCVQCEAAPGVLLFYLLVQASFRCVFLLCLSCALEALVVVGHVALPTCGGLLWRVLPISRAVSAVGATVLHLAEFWCLWWHPLLVLEWFIFVSSGALVHCVALWVAPGACVSTVALSVVRQALVVAVSESFPLALGSECVRLWVVVATTGKSQCDLVVPLHLLFSSTGVAMEVPVVTVISITTTACTDLSGCHDVPWGCVLVAVWAAIALRWRCLPLALLRHSGLVVAPAARGGAARSEEEAVVASVWATPECSIPEVGLPSDVTTVVCIATSEMASPRSGATLLRRRSRQHLVCLECFRGRSWRVSVCPRAGLPFRPSVLTPDCCFGNSFLGVIRGGTGVCSSLTSWSVRGAGWFCLWALYLVEGDTWLFLLDLVEVRDVGACVMRLGSHVVAPVFRKLLCLSGFASTLLEFLLLWLVRDWLSLLSLVRKAHPLLSSAHSISTTIIVAHWLREWPQWDELSAPPQLHSPIHHRLLAVPPRASATMAMIAWPPAANPNAERCSHPSSMDTTVVAWTTNASSQLRLLSLVDLASCALPLLVCVGVGG